MTHYSEVRALLRRRRWIFLLTLLGAVAGHSALIHFSGQEFNAAGLVRVRTDGPSEFGGFQMPGSNSDIYQSLTPQLLIRMTQEPGFEREVNARLEKSGQDRYCGNWEPDGLEVSVAKSTGNDFLELVFRSRDPEIVVPVATAALDTVREQAQSYFLATVHGRRDRMKNVVETHTTKYRGVGEELAQIRSEHELPPRDGMLIHQQTGLRQSLEQLKLQRNSIVATVEEIEESLSELERPPETQYEIIEAVRGLPIYQSLATLSKKVVESEIEVQRLEGEKTDKHPDLIEARDSLAEDRRILNSVFEEDSPLYPTIQEALHSNSSVRSNEVRRLSARHVAATSRLTSTDELIAEKNSRLARLRVIEPEVLRLEESKLRFQHDLQGMVAQLHQLDMLSSLAPEVVQVVRPPSTVGNEAPSFGRVAPLILILAGLLGTAAVYLVEWLDQRIYTQGCLARSVALPFLGSVPRLAVGRRRVPDPGETNPALDAVHWSLMRIQSSLRGGRVLMLASPHGGDGRSFLAMNMAICAGRQGLRTLLIDADLEHPMLHTHMRLPRRPGLVDELTGGAEERRRALRTRVEASFLRKGTLRVRPDEIPTDMTSGSVGVIVASGEMLRPIRSTEHSHVDLLTAGHPTDRAPALFESESFSRLLEEARKKYQLVILDTPPLTQSADALILSRRCDGVVVVARVGHTIGTDLTWVTQSIVDVEAPVLGTVLNAAEGSWHSESENVAASASVDRWERV